MQEKPETEKPVNVQMTRDWNRPDILAVDEDRKDPAKNYRHVAKTGTNWDRKKQDGWVPTEVDKDGKPFSQELHDLRLCEMPKERVKARSEYYEEKNKQLEASVRSTLVSQGQRSGMPAYDATPQGGRKSFAMPNNPLGRQ